MASFDHLGLPVSNVERSKAFYRKALAPLGISVLKTVPASVTGSFEFVGLGRDGMPDFWLSQKATVSPPLHIAFAARSRAEVDAFHAAALAAGATDNGPPGPRPIYHPGYYGAFVLDPDGHNIEAVCHRPE
jgi:catechol 2,3-dioxygenase-like lactoylglutathione lyase family enzyme